MAGMLPGVECARRRRFHQANDTPGPAVNGGGSRRSSFCLYTSNHDTYHTSMSSSLRNILSKAREDEKLGGVAREAKERLDGRLRAKRKELTRRQGSKMGGDQGRSTTGELQTEVFGGKRRFNWAKLSWKAGEQDECTICLEIFKSGETLVHLPCAHRFHSKCLVPWLESTAHCPCCRLEINVDVVL